MMQRRPAMTMLAIRAAIDSVGQQLDRTIPDGVTSAMATRAVARGELAVEDVSTCAPVVEMVLWGVSVVGGRHERDAPALLRGDRAGAVRPAGAPPGQAPPHGLTAKSIARHNSILVRTTRIGEGAGE